VAGPVPIDRIVSLKHLLEHTSGVTLLVAYVDQMKLWSWVAAKGVRQDLYQ
jgi:hypothetical protein